MRKKNKMADPNDYSSLIFNVFLFKNSNVFVSILVITEIGHVKIPLHVFEPIIHQNTLIPITGSLA